MRVCAVVSIVLVWSVSVFAQPALVEPPEFPGQVPGPVADHPGGGCFLLATGTIEPGDVDWVQVFIPWPSTQTVVDVDFPAGAGSSALIATTADGTQGNFNQSDNNNSRDTLCGLSGGTSPPGSLTDSALTLFNTPRNVLINIGVSASQDTSFSGQHSQNFAYSLWVRIQPVLCTSDASCADPVACTLDTCDTSTGICTNAPQDAACDNSSFCDGDEWCHGQLGCRPGLSPDCDDDGVDCTDDYCDSQIDACVHEPVDEFCDDGSFCNGYEVCDTTADCQPGTVPDCDDGVDCTTDSCDDDDDGICVHATNDGACDNGLACDGAERCDALLGCQAGASHDCDDGVACTVDSCDESNGDCAHVTDDGVCDNGLFCDGAEQCDAWLGCQAGSPPDCDDGVGCTVDSCDESNGDCVHTPDDEACDNGLFCDGTESCEAEGCIAGTDPCDANEACNEADQTCVVAAIVTLDIQPGECPNRLQRIGPGQFAAALVGSAGFDVRQINPNSLRLSRVDGVGRFAQPDSRFLRPQAIADVATPYAGNQCGCHTMAGDGINDWRLGFDTREVFDRLRLDSMSGVVELRVTGRLRNGVEFEARDCVMVVSRPGRP